MKPASAAIWASHLSARAPLALLAVLLGVAVAACSGGGDETIPPGSPVVLVSIDTLRSDRLPAYGYDAIATPAIDGLRRDGILFERAYSHVPLTLPSHSSILTGLLPARHGVRDNLGYRLETADLPYLPRLLKQQGYATGAAISAFVLRGATGLASDFDFYDDRIQIVSDAALGTLQRPGAETVQSALAWVDSVRDGPFFLFLHLYEPHSPYTPPEPYASFYRSPYDGEVAAVDEVVGRLLDRLRELDLYDPSLIVLLSDHGEGLMDHGEQEHELLLYREAIQVPLILKLPGSRHAGASVAAPVQLIDVAPTVLSLLGAAPPEAMRGTPLLRYLDGEPPERTIYSESTYPKLHFGWSQLTSLVAGSYHLIDGPDPELYDLAADPGETVNLVQREQRRFAALRRELATFDRELAAPADVDPETRQRLAALGYVGHSAGVDREGPLPDPKSRLPVLADLKAAFEAFSRGDYEHAVGAFRKVLAEEPEMVDAWEHLGKSLQRLGRHDEALRAFQRAFELSGGAPHVALAIADLMLRTGQLDAAAEHARLALPAHEIAYDLLARIALEKDDLEDADRWLQKALETRGTRIGPLLTAARLHLERQEFAAALELTEQAEKEFGDRTDQRALRGLFLLRGRALAGLARLDEAQAAFLEEVRRFPREIEAYTYLAYFYGAQGAGPQAGATLRRMVQVNDTAEAWAAAVRTLRLMGDTDSAAAVLQRARSRWPRSSELRDLAG